MLQVSKTQAGRESRVSCCIMLHHVASCSNVVLYVVVSIQIGSVLLGQVFSYSRKGTMLSINEGPQLDICPSLSAGVSSYCHTHGRDNESISPEFECQAFGGTSACCRLEGLNIPVCILRTVYTK